MTLSACSSKSETCPEGQITCNGQCVSTSDPDHCGSCSTVCSADQVCSQGTCGTSCEGGLLSCSRSCVNAATDVNNCGGCGTICATGSTCEAGRCTTMVVECKDRLPLQSSGAYDRNLKTVQISGKLTKNGAMLPSGFSRGSLVFSGKRGGAVYASAFPSSGDATYEVELFSGVYDVTFIPSSSCRTGDPMPCQQMLLQSGVQLSTDSEHDFDALTVKITGKLTKNGTAVPSDTTDRGSMVFALQGGGTYYAPPFGSTGEAKYTAEIFAGTYDVRYQPYGGCRVGGVLPCQQATLRSNVQITASGALDFDAKTAQVTGKLTKNGAAVPTDFTDRGYLVFSLQSGGALTMPSFGTSGAATYKGEIFAGTYDIGYLPYSSCQSDSVLPCQQATLRTRVAISASGALDFDAKTVNVTGKLTKNGAAVPSDTTDRGYLVFSLLSGGAFVMPSFGTSGAAKYEGEIFAGSYDIGYLPDNSCQLEGALPCQQVNLATKTAVTTSGALDFDTKTVNVTGKLTKNGAPLPDDTNDRGTLMFSLRNGGSFIMPSFETTGAATYEGEIFAGSYDVTYLPYGSCQPDGVLPCQQLTLRTKTPLMASGALDLDVKTVTVSGMVTKNGAVMPDSSRDRGRLVFSPLGGSDFAMPSFETEGPATYQGEIFAGSYNISYQPYSSCRIGGALPCQSLLIVGCAPTTP